MKKLGKKAHEMVETIEAYCSCSCTCGCSCSCSCGDYAQAMAISSSSTHASVSSPGVYSVQYGKSYSLGT